MANLLFQNILSEFRVEIESLKIVPALATGFSSGLGLLVAQIAFGSFIFSGELAHYSSLGIGLVLFGNFAACLIISITSGYRGAIAGLSPALVIIMALIAFSMNAEGEQLFVTVVVAFMICAAATGISSLVIGHFRIANLLRFIPYSVACGFVAGIGGAVCLAAMSISGVDLKWRNLAANFDPAVLINWAPGIVFGTVIYIAVKRWRNSWLFPVSMLIAVAAYHVGLVFFNISVDEARAAGFLLSGSEENIWPALWPSDLLRVDWAAIVGQIHNMLMLIMIAYICIIMNIAGLELAVNQDLNWDREFKSTGLASIVSGLGGGTVSTLIVPASLRSKLFRAHTRLTGIVAAAVIGCALFLGDELLEIIPVALIGGILVFAGLGMVDEGLVKSWKILPLSEYSVILLIFFIINLIGLIEGVTAGVLLTLVFFTVRLNRVNPIKDQFTARERHSKMARSVPDRAILRAEGDRVQAYRLRGYIFFGSVVPLVENLRNSLTDATSCLMLDFTAVSGVDFSAVRVFSKFLEKLHADETHLVLVGLSDMLRSGLEQNLQPEIFKTIHVEPDADFGLERCEDIIITEWNADAAKTDPRGIRLFDATADDIEFRLEQQIQFEELIEELEHWLIPREYSANEILTGPDRSQDGLQFLLSGRASVYDHTGTRLRQFIPGDAIWPVRKLDDHANLVLADDSCRTMVMAPTDMHWLEETEERLALKFYRYLIAQTFNDQLRADPSLGNLNKPEEQA